MRVINKGADEPLNFPGVCVFTKTSDDNLIDTGCWLNAKELNGVDPYGYVAEGFVKVMAREIGMVEASEHEAVVAELEALKAEADENAAKAAAWDALSAAKEKVPA